MSDMTVTNVRPPISAIQTDSPKLRTGADYRAAIGNDGRHIVHDGEVIRDVTHHAAFRGVVDSVAHLWDVAADPSRRDEMCFVSPTTGGPVLRCFQIPRSSADLAARRGMIERWAEATFGLVGRAPDHVAGFLTGFAAKPSVFATAGKEYAENVVRFYEQARDNHLYVAYAIVPPQIDRSKPAHKQSDPTLYACVVKERDDGLVLRGAQQLATGAAIADYIYISCIHPLQPGDEAHAFGVVMPINSPGLKIYTRRSYATTATSRFDYPLSSRFDETDALVVLDDALVPWENVFFYRNIDLCRDQWRKTPSHLYGNHQAQIRYAMKLRFLLGLAKRTCEMTGIDTLPAGQIQLGEMAALASIVENMIFAQESQATVDGDGIVWPSRTALYSVMALQSELNPRIVDLARELSGGSMIMLPSSVKDFDNPETAADLARYVHSPGIAAKDRIALLKMAWDLIGTEFAGRHQQYEKFYGGASFVIKQNMYQSYDFARAKRLVEAALALD
jgi:4-hydroxyphenylacetate 3-monooxygenase